MTREDYEVPVDKLINRCDPDELGFETTDELDANQGPVGQDRAMTALALALDIKAAGFNLYVSGHPGTGRNTTLRNHLDQISSGRPVPADWGYIHNFNDPFSPTALSLPCGMMRVFAKEMEGLVADCRREVTDSFESDDYTHCMEDATKDIQDRRQALATDLEQQAQKLGFAVVSSQGVPTPVPLLEGQPMTEDEYGQVADLIREELQERGEKVRHLIHGMQQEARRLNKEAAARAGDIERELAAKAIRPLFADLGRSYADHWNVLQFLEQVEADMLQNLSIFKSVPAQSDVAQPGPNLAGLEDPFLKYRVNDLVDSTSCDGAPVIFENSPTYYNIFGQIEYKARGGALTTDLTMIRAGAIHKANGGYLVLQARDLMLSPLSWEALKRSLRTDEVIIENIGEQNSLVPSVSLRPEPIPLNVKVILVGNAALLQALRDGDEDFNRLFKVSSDFDTAMERTEKNISGYSSFVADRSKAKGLRPFHNTAVARIIDHASRLVEEQEELSTRFSIIGDVMAEADYWASDEGSATVTGDHVRKAVEQRKHRAALVDEKLRKRIEDGTIHIDTDGTKVGQINGLAVLAVGDYNFGKPSRVTASVALGQGQLVNIERESNMSGRIHDKGFLTLSGYLLGKYGQNKPLSLSASIGFEQTYSYIDGDSASSTELYALLSALSGLPIDQSIAVTGAVNQFGEVQAIGGAIYKIEGFFDICKAKGLTSRQGVIVPRDNIKNLILREDVVAAVRSGDFHIYAVSTIDQGIEILTGVSAGTISESGEYPRDTVHQLVEQRLCDNAEKAREFVIYQNGHVAAQKVERS